MICFLFVFSFYFLSLSFFVYFVCVSMCSALTLIKKTQKYPPTILIQQTLSLFTYKSIILSAYFLHPFDTFTPIGFARFTLNKSPTFILNTTWSSCARISPTWSPPTHTKWLVSPFPNHSWRATLIIQNSLTIKFDTATKLQHTSKKHSRNQKQ